MACHKAQQLALVAVIAACGVSGPSTETYTLTEINQDPLPAPFGLTGEYPPAFEVTSGSLTLSDDSLVTQLLIVRCRDSLPINTTCEVTNDGNYRLDGVFSRVGGSVRFNGVSSPAVFDGDSIVVLYGSSFSTGQPYFFEFRRSTPRRPASAATIPIPRRGR